MSTRALLPVVVVSLVTGACVGSIDHGFDPEPQPGGGTSPSVMPPRSMPPRADEPPASQPPGETRWPEPRLWALNPRQYAATIAALLGEPVDAKLEKALADLLPESGAVFSNAADRSDLNGTYTRALAEATEPVSERAFALRARFGSCLTGPAPDAACIDAGLHAFGLRAFRRPLTDEELGRYRTFYRDRAAQDGPAIALRLTFHALLLAPQCLFRSELGQPVGTTRRLDAYERASALSFLFLDGPPDQDLLAAAASGALATAAGLRAQAERLAARAEARGLLQFFTELWALDQVLVVGKDAKVYPQWNATLAGALREESRRFASQVLWKDGARLSQLFTADYTLANGVLGTFYGVAGAAAGAPWQVVRPGSGRSGFLTHGSVLAAQARNNESDIVRRGVFVRERVLCQHPPPPPPEANAVPPQPDGKRTQRQLLSGHAAPSCVGCHKLIDPLGAAFETFDGIGRRRPDEALEHDDTAGELVGTSRDGSFADARGLAALLAAHPDAEACMVSRLYEYAHGQAPGTGDEARLAALVEGFRRTGGDLLALAVDIVTGDDFVTRQESSPEGSR